MLHMRKQLSKYECFPERRWLDARPLSFMYCNPDVAGVLCALIYF